MRRTAILIVVLLTSLCGIVPPAVAHPPRQSTDVFTGKLIIHCKGFSLRNDFTLTSRHQTFVDSDGHRVRTISHYRWNGVITNRATGAFVATDPGRWQEMHAGPTSALHGLLYGIKISSLGIHILGVGTLVRDVETGDIVFQSSTNDHHQDYADLCRALS